MEAGDRGVVAKEVDRGGGLSEAGFAKGAEGTLSEAFQSSVTYKYLVPDELHDRLVDVEEGEEVAGGLTSDEEVILSVPALASCLLDNREFDSPLEPYLEKALANLGVTRVETGTATPRRPTQ
ncbi:hypothetical protein [Streptomyces olivaceiscleroticus]|uniref:Uncharacterized protein n=1 Tax=Streptomyces olivaceiscleroticus TaxID=68245 RepID=A0ABN0ZIW2_9ACTN